MLLQNTSMQGTSMLGVSLRGFSMDGRGGDTPLDFSGYPLALDLPNARSMKTYTLFGNTSEDAKGVGDEVVQMTDVRSRVGDGIIKIIDFVNGHKYLAIWTQDVDIPSSARNTIRVDYIQFQKTQVDNNPDKGKYSWLFTFNGESGIHAFAWWIQGYPAGITPSISDISFFDLTAIFGAGNEPATADEFANRLGYASAEELPYFPNAITMGKVDLGSLTWIKQTVTGGSTLDRFACTTLSDKKPGFENLSAQGFQVNPNVFNNILLANAKEICGRSNNNYIYISTEKGLYFSGAEFQRGVQGVILEYELATPIPTSTTVMPMKVASRNLYSTRFSDFSRDQNYYTMPIPPRTGTKVSYSITRKGEVMTGVYVGFVGSGKNYAEFSSLMPILNASGQEYSGSFVLTDSFTDTRLAVYASGEAQFNKIFENYDIQFKIGDQAPYTPYFPPRLFPNLLSAPLHKVGDVADTVDSKGKEVHALGVVDLGTLEWSFANDSDGGFFRTVEFPLKREATPGMSRLICPAFSVGVATYYSNPKADKTIYESLSGGETRKIYAVDRSYTDAASFKAAMQGVMLVYELATPTEVQGEPLPRLAIPKGESIVTLDTQTEPSNITAKV